MALSRYMSNRALGYGFRVILVGGGGGEVEHRLKKPTGHDGLHLCSQPSVPPAFAVLESL